MGLTYCDKCKIYTQGPHPSHPLDIWVKGPVLNVLQYVISYEPSDSKKEFTHFRQVTPDSDSESLRAKLDIAVKALNRRCDCAREACIKEWYRQATEALIQIQAGSEGVKK